MPVYEYHLKRATLRPIVDLSEYQDDIETGVFEIFPTCTNFRVHQDYFEFHLSRNASGYELRQMGKMIVANNSDLIQFIQQYTYNENEDGSSEKSNQLFVKKN